MNQNATYDFYREANEDCYFYDEAKEKRKRVRKYVEILFLCLILFGVILTLYISIKKLQAIKKGTLNPEFIETLKRYNLLAVFSAWLASLYFTYVTYTNYKETPSMRNFNFFLAAVLVFVGFTMRFVLIYQNRSMTVDGPEDVI